MSASQQSNFSLRLPGAPPIASGSVATILLTIIFESVMRSSFCSSSIDTTPFFPMPTALASSSARVSFV